MSKCGDLKYELFLAFDRLKGCFNSIMSCVTRYPIMSPCTIPISYPKTLTNIRKIFGAVLKTHVAAAGID